MNLDPTKTRVCDRCGGTMRIVAFSFPHNRRPIDPKVTLRDQIKRVTTVWECDGETRDTCWNKVAESDGIV